MLQWVQAPGETESTRTNYSYDGKLRATGVSKGASAVGYSSYSTDGNHQLTRSDYGNGDSGSYGCDSLGQLVPDENTTPVVKMIFIFSGGIRGQRGWSAEALQPLCPFRPLCYRPFS